MNEIKHGVAWSDSYRLGNEQVDTQHYHLFELLSDLIEACMNGSDTEKLKETLDFMVDYTIQHFRDEENLQLQCNYPDYKRHKQLHEIFKCTIVGLVEKFEKNGSSADLSNDVNRVIVRWLISHIQREDKKIGEHIRKQSAAIPSAIYANVEKWV